jgi:hypothetical protein
MKTSRKVQRDLRDPAEAKTYLRDAAKKYNNDNDFDAMLKALMDVVDEQGDKKKRSPVDKVDSSRFHKGMSRAVTQKQMSVLKMMGLFGKEEAQ